MNYLTDGNRTNGSDGAPACAILHTICVISSRGSQTELHSLQTRSWVETDTQISYWFAQDQISQDIGAKNTVF